MIIIMIMIMIMIIIIKTFSIIKILLKVENDALRWMVGKYYSSNVVFYLADVNKMQPDRQKLKKTKIKNPA